MREYSNKISLMRTARGVYGLDPFKGCGPGTAYDKRGCYGVCYAANIAKFRGYNFNTLVYRHFDGHEHLRSVCNKVKSIRFVRLGVMCDPSCDWNHTLEIVNKIRSYQKNIVIVTKHWTSLTDEQLLELEGLCVNTSISALDTDEQIEHRLSWYNKLKGHCKSVLRVNTADFNDPGMIKKQKDLINNEDVIDNILRIPKSHKLVRDKTLNVIKSKFLSTKTYSSISNVNTYFGDCSNCPDMCGFDDESFDLYLEQMEIFN